MSGILRIFMILGAVFLMIFMIKRIRQAKMKIEYTVFWIVFSGILVLMGLFPQLLYWISKMLGFQSPINMVYLVVIFVLIVKLFLISIQISQLENKVDSLTQQVAIDRKVDKEDK